MPGFHIGATLAVVEHQAMKRRTRRIPARFQFLKPLGKIEFRGVRRKRDGAACEEGGEDRYLQPMRIKWRAHAQTAIVWRQMKPVLKPCRRSQHVAMTEGDQLRFGRSSRSLKNERGS